MTREQPASSANGWVAAVVLLMLAILAAALFLFGTAAAVTAGAGLAIFTLLGALLGVLVVVCLGGFFTLQPNEARALVFFGAYKGTVRDNGFFWVNPFYSKSGRLNVSLRARTLVSPTLKVNDKRGNPIEIAAVVVWHVADTAQALFDVENYEAFVAMQTETALRHVSSVYAYDHTEDTDSTSAEFTLRSNIEEVSAALKAELQERLAAAGTMIDDVRLSHLAYAAEIAQVMLRRQQAEAIIAARRKIVHGAVTMVEMAISELQDNGVVMFDDARRASLASNLMVVLCGETEVNPVVNTGASA